MSNTFFSRVPHLLIVDDEPDNFDVIEGFLFTEKYHLSYAQSVQKAFLRLERQAPDLIILDAMMPDIDGFSFCRRLKKTAQWHHIPVMMITALGNDYLAACLESGADDFLAKPINKIVLKARVHSLLRMKFQYDALKTSRQLRADLTDMVIHDFTTPITTLLLQTEILERQSLPKDLQRGVQRLRQAAHTLEGLRNDFLTYGRAEAGALTLQPECFVVQDFVKSAVADLANLAQSRRIKLQLICPPSVAQKFTGDHPLLTRVVNNLLTNALKFSPPNSTIMIVVESRVNPLTKKMMLVLQVKDQGRGVPDEQKEKIFQKYHIGSQQKNTRQTGLGLAFCKLVVDAHGGVIFVQDNQPKGAVFQVEIPDLSPLA